MNRLSSENPGDLLLADKILGEGGLVAVPTETVYGLAADARIASSVRRIFETKGRPLLDPLIVHFFDVEQIVDYCLPHPSLADLAAAFWPGPLTLILPLRQGTLDPVVTAGLPTLAVRVPAHPVLRQLLSIERRPLAAPSANPFGYISPTRAQHVADHLGDRIDALLDGGSCRFGVESTILSLVDPDQPRILRPGPISHSELSTILGDCVTVRTTDEHKAKDTPLAPGQLPSHYSPAKPLKLITEGKLLATPHSPGLSRVFLQRPCESSISSQTYWLSEVRDPAEIAHNLFNLLRQLDKDPGTTRIEIEFPEGDTGLLPALRDRLQRAAHSHQ